MDIFDLIKLSTRMFFVRASRTLLTVLGMGVGIAVILFLFSFGYGLQKTLLEKITTSDSILTLDVMEQKNGSVKLNADLAERIKTFPGVREVSPIFSFRSNGTIGGVSAEISTLAVEGNYFRLSGLKMAKGRFLGEEAEKEIVISQSLADIFGEKKKELIGQELTLEFFAPVSPEALQKETRTTVKERPVLETKYRVVGIAGGKKNGAFVSGKTVASIQGERFSQLKVRAENDPEMKTARENLVGLQLSVSALSDTVAQANKVFQLFQIALLFFGVVALLVSAIGMFNTMTVTLMERTEEIGIMKSVGASAREISLIFLSEAAIMGLLGGVVGILLGLGTGELFNFMINLVASYFGGEAVDLFSSPLWFVLSIFAFSGLVGLLTGFFPARRAGRINPLDALRYK